MINSAIFWVFPSFLLSSVVSLTATLDSGLSITSFGVTVDTFSLVASLEAHLQDTYGRSLAQRSSKLCLDSDYRLGFFSYAPYTTGCDPRKESQNWRLVGGALKTGSSQLATEGCLTCWSQAEDCFLYLMACRAPKAASQQFHVRIHASQLNLVKGTIGFSVHSGLYPGRCIAPYRNDESTQARPGERQIFYLAECNASAEQTFYLPSLDLLLELSQLRFQIIETLGGRALELKDIANYTQTCA